MRGGWCLLVFLVVLTLQLAGVLTSWWLVAVAAGPLAAYLACWGLFVLLAAVTGRRVRY